MKKIQLAFAAAATLAVAQAAHATYAEPYFSGDNDTLFGGAADGPDATQYLTTGTGDAILTFATPQTYLGFVWGSVDNYNTVTFYNGTTQLATFTPPAGGNIPVPAPAGDQDELGTYWVDFKSTTPFNKVVLSSSNYAFEIDNIATAVPEPSTYLAGALLLLPFGAGAFRAMRSRKES